MVKDEKCYCLLKICNGGKKSCEGINQAKRAQGNAAGIRKSAGGTGKKAAGKRTSWLFWKGSYAALKSAGP